MCRGETPDYVPIFGFPGGAVIDIYDDSTGTWSTATLSVPRTRMGAATVGNLGGEVRIGLVEGAVEMVPPGLVEGMICAP